MDINTPTTKKDGDKLFTAVGTEATTNSVVKIDTKFYAFDDDCKVYYIGTDGTLIASAPASTARIPTIRFWFKLTDGLLSTVFIKVVDETSAVNPSNGTVASSWSRILLPARSLCSTRTLIPLRLLTPAL